MSKIKPNAIYEGGFIPVNRQAGLAFSRDPEPVPAKAKSDDFHWTAPPKMKRPPRSFEDLTGRQIDRLTVVGFLDDPKRNRWVCRCVCGRYEPRSQEALIEKREAVAACRACAMTRGLRSKSKKSDLRQQRAFVRKDSPSGQIRDHWSECPALRSRSDNETTLPELEGERCGRLTAVGLAADRKARWVVRCDCGVFEIRSTKALRNPLNADDMCQFCAFAIKGRES